MITLTNKEALQELLNGNKIVSTMWGEGKYLHMNVHGLIISKHGIPEDWNEMASFYKDSWILIIN